MGIYTDRCNSCETEEGELVLVRMFGMDGVPVCRKCLGAANAKAIEADQVRMKNTPPTFRYINPNALCPCGTKPFKKAKYCCGV